MEMQSKEALNENSDIVRSSNERKIKTKVDKSTSTKLAFIPNLPKRQFYKRELPCECIAFSSEQGRKLFLQSLTSGYANVYFPLAEQFTTQAEPSYCGLTTLVMVLNTLAVDPKRIWRGGWRWYHEEMLDCCMPLDLVQQQGITMDQFICLAACNSLDLNQVRINERESIEDFRDALKTICVGTETVLVCSYSRQVMGQTGDGHFSPIGAYNLEEDMILIFDVARFKYPPHWVKVETMWEAMKKLDSATDKARGYIVMRKTEEKPLVLFRLSSTFRVTIATHNLLESHMAAFLKTWKAFLKEAMPCDFNCEGSFANTLKCLLEALNEALDSLMEGESIFTTQFNICCTEMLPDEHLEDVQNLLYSLEKTELFKTTKIWIVEFKKKAAKRQTKCQSLKNCVKSTCCRVSRCGQSVTDIEEIELPQSISTKKSCISAKCREQKRRLVEESHYLVMFLLCWPYNMESESTHTNSLSEYVQNTLQNTDKILQNEVHLLRKQIESLVLMVGKHDKI